ncbi:MAG: type VI secretion system baseplate subunit TssG [Chthoniobacterales bacterium]|nr:MAG: type VI secretion system baseplate subunit TssG [Chthoniobacterales bacterium]
MASPSGSPDSSLALPDLILIEVERVLREEPGTFNFFQAVRLMHRLRADRDGVGGFGPPGREALHFGVHNSLAFPASQIASIDWTGDVPRMAVNFMGLTGHAGVLPYHYTELIRDRLRAKDATLPAFLDIFNHRILALFYRAWEKYRFPVAYERAAFHGERTDNFSSYLLSLIGVAMPGLRDRQEVDDHSLLFFTGLLSLQPRSAAALTQLLEEYFGVDFEVEQFVGAWQKLGKPDQCIFAEEDTWSEQLGVGAVVGDEVWDVQSRARIRIGPLSEQEYLDFLPAGKCFEPLRALLRFFNGEIQYELQLILKRAEVPACELGRDGTGGTQLGWFTWMKSGPGFNRNPEDTVLLLN